MVFGFIIPIVMFDVLENDTYNYATYLEFTDKTDVPGQIQNIGYENNSSLQNLGSIAIFFSIYFVKVFLFIILLMLSLILFGKRRKLVTSISQALFFTEFVSLSIDAYMELLISGFLNLSDQKVFESKLLGDKIGVWACIMCLSFSLVIIPLMILYVFCQSIEKMKSKDFENRWGPFYLDIKSGSKIQMFFFPMHCIRRLIYVAICQNLKEYPSIQIICALFLNMFILIYIGTNKSLGSFLKNRIEMFNEFMICSVTFIIMNFTDWVGARPVRTEYGWIMNCMVFVIIAFNSFFVLWYGFGSIRLMC